MHTALLLEMAAGALGDRTATGSITGGVTYDELAARARAGGHWLAGPGGGSGGLPRPQWLRDADHPFRQRRDRPAVRAAELPPAGRRAAPAAGPHRAVDRH